MKPIAFKETQLQSDQDVIECGVDVTDLQHLFNLLVNAYSDPIGSAVREVVSNAFDATIELMKETGQDLETHLMNYPVDVNLTEDYFSVRDYGIGMDDERINGLYANLGRSSKRESNDYIGAFGIGRFSPLSYTDNFIVVTIKNGVKTTFQMVGKEIPVIVPMGKIDTNEHSGTEIIINLKSGDAKNFVHAIRTQLRFMENIFFGGKVKDLNKSALYKGDNFWLSDVDVTPPDKYYYAPPHYVLVGRVAYPLEASKVRGLNKIHRTMAVKMDIGSVSVTPNREQILYTDETVKALNKAIANVHTEMELLASDQCELTDDFEDYFKYLDANRPLKLGKFQLSMRSFGIKITKRYKPFVDIGVVDSVAPFMDYNFIDPENKSRASYKKTKLTYEKLALTWFKTMKVYAPKAEALGCRYYLNWAPVNLQTFLSAAGIKYKKTTDGSFESDAERRKHEVIRDKFRAEIKKIIKDECAGDYDTAKYDKPKRKKAVKKLVIHEYTPNTYGGFWKTMDTDEEKIAAMPFPFVYIDFTTGYTGKEAQACVQIFKVPVYKLSKEAQKYIPRHAISPERYYDIHSKNLKMKFAEYKLAEKITDVEYGSYWEWFNEIYPGAFCDRIKAMLDFEPNSLLQVDNDPSLVRKSSLLALNKLIRFQEEVGVTQTLEGMSHTAARQYLEMKGFFGPEAQAKALRSKSTFKKAEEWLT